MAICPHGKVESRCIHCGDVIGRLESVEKTLLNEADPIEFAASEYRCAMKVLDDMGVPRGELSLVGRIGCAISMVTLK